MGAFPPHLETLNESALSNGPGFATTDATGSLQEMK
jgi:hypothetical protein